MRVTLVLCIALSMVACTTTNPSTGAEVPYPTTLSHANTPSGDVSAFPLQHKQVLVVKINETDTKCFTYNGLGITAPAVAAARRTNPNTEREIKLSYDESFKGFEILVKRNNDVTNQCANTTLKDARWVIPVLSAWRVAMSGAVTFDKLTDPVFYLESGKNAGGTDGFFVRQKADDEDVVRTSAGAMAHLYNVNHRGWIPLTFGVSLAKDPTYLIGMGYRLGQQGQLSVGAAIGPRAHLPSQLRVGGFVTDANSINTLGSRTDVELFFSVSLAFLERNLSKITGIIKPAE
jgi:hypothetical protein